MFGLQNVKDDRALQLLGQLDQHLAKIETLWTRLTAAFAEQQDEAWARLTTQTELGAVAFHLNEERELAPRKMAPALEALANELATDGYHAWDRLYGVMAGDKEVTFDGQPLSLGQLQNKYIDDPDRDVRRRAFALFEKSWAELAKNCSLALNHLAGFRLTLYQHRGWDSVLQEPLLDNRLTALPWKPCGAWSKLKAPNFWIILRPRRNCWACSNWIGLMFRRL